VPEEHETQRSEKDRIIKDTPTAGLLFLLSFTLFEMLKKFHLLEAFHCFLFGLIAPELPVCGL
jgi:uncharacterized membrane protein YpjA